MSTPVYAIAYRDAALTIGRASARFWTAFRPTPRSHHHARHLRRRTPAHAVRSSAAPSTSPAKTTGTFRSCRCSSKRAKVPTTRNSPKPRCRNPRPIRSKKCIDDPGTGEQTLDAPMLADATPMLEAGSRRRAARDAAARRRSRARGRRSTNYHRRLGRRRFRWSPSPSPRAPPKSCRSPSRSCSRATCSSSR